MVSIRSTYHPIDAAILWCDLADHHDEILQVDLSHPGCLLKHFPQWPFLHAYAERIYDAIFCGELPAIRSHRLLINDSKAKIHGVNGTYFLVTPGIFQCYVAQCSQFTTDAEKIEAWKQSQRQFERLDMHVKRPNGQNIWTCKVQGPRKKSALNGYLVREAEIISDEPAADNVFLTLLT